LAERTRIKEAGVPSRGACCCRGEDAKKCHIVVTHLAAIFMHLPAGGSVSGAEAGYPAFTQPGGREIVYRAREDSALAVVVTRVQVKHDDGKDTGGCQVTGDLEFDHYVHARRESGTSPGDMGGGQHSLYPDALNTSSGGNWYIDSAGGVLPTRAWQGQFFQMHVTVSDGEGKRIGGIEAWYGYAWSLKGGRLSPRLWPPGVGVAHVDPKSKVDRDEAAQEMGMPSG
jgi:hypothetical protein